MPLTSFVFLSWISPPSTVAPLGMVYHRGGQSLAIDGGSLGPRDIDVSAKRVIDLGDLEGHFVIRIDPRDDLKGEVRHPRNQSSRPPRCYYSY